MAQVGVLETLKSYVKMAYLAVMFKMQERRVDQTEEKYNRVGKCN